MKSFIQNKAAGFYLLLVSGVLALASFIYYVTWGQANYATNAIVIVTLTIGFAINILLLFYDNDYLIIVVTGLYSAALCQLIMDNVGSFVDAYQGIIMFGDPTQVGTVLSIAALMGMGVLVCIVSGFLNRKKQAY